MHLVGPSFRLPSLGLASLLAFSLAAGEGDDPSLLLKKSEALRTALHADPTLGAPLEALVRIYREAGRTNELIELYAAHLRRFPQAVGARIVLVRLKLLANEPDALRTTQSAAAAAPDEPFLQYLLFQALLRFGEPGALDALDRALDADPARNPTARRWAWTKELLPLAREHGRLDLVTKHLDRVAGLLGDDAPALLEAARLMLDHRAPERALQVLETARKAEPNPETQVAIEQAAAGAEGQLGKTSEAIARLEALLRRLTPDHWSREEIVRQRIGLARDDASRQALLAEARARFKTAPRDEAAAVDLAVVFTGCDQHRQALEVLLTAAETHPNSVRLEKLVLRAFERLQDVRAAELWLAKRLEKTPRRDLALHRARLLFDLDRAEDGQAAIAKALAEVPEKERLDHQLQLARTLRAGQHLHAARVLFAAISETRPERLDLRREYAEVLKALGDLPRMRVLFADPPSKGVEVEQVVDLVRFLHQERLWSEAQRLLNAKLAELPEDFDLRALLVQTRGHLGNGRAGTEDLAELRKRADTPTRYRRYLETLVGFAQNFDLTGRMLLDELQRIQAEAGTWEAATRERLGILLAIGGTNGLAQDLARTTRQMLAGKPGPELTLLLRRSLIDLSLGSTQTSGADLIPDLQALIKEDPSCAEEHRTRLAILYQRQQREDLAWQTAKTIDPSKIGTTTLLAQLNSLFRQRNDGSRLKAIARRLVELDPSVSQHWENLITALAVTGDEPALRLALRRLLAGVENVPLTAEVRQLLTTHHSASIWRSVAAALSDHDADRLHQALGLLDVVERSDPQPETLLWSTWVRTRLLLKLERSGPAAAASSEFERMAKDLVARQTAERQRQAEEQARKNPPAKPAAPGQAKPVAGAAPSAPADEPVLLTLPDGTGVTLDTALALLAEAPSQPPAAGDAQGPTTTPVLAWSATLDGVVCNVFAHGDTVLAVDSGNTLWNFAADTGKLRWHLDLEEDHAEPATRLVAGTLPRVPHWMRRGRFMASYGNLPPAIAPQAPTLGQILQAGDLIFLAGDNTVACRAVADGTLRYRIQITPSHLPRSSQALVAMTLSGEDLLAFDPAGPLLAAFERTTGRLRWERSLPVSAIGNSRIAAAQQAQMQMMMGSYGYGCGGYPRPIEEQALPMRSGGITVSGDRIFAHADSAWVLDRRDGRLLWKFSPDGASRFPSPLTDTAPSANQVKSWVSWQQPPEQLVVDFLHPGKVDSLLGQVMSSHQKTLFHASSPVAQWVTNQAPRQALLTGRRLVLIGAQGVQICDLDLPCSGPQSSFKGTVLGLSGDHLCQLLPLGQLFILRLSDGRSRTIDCSDVARPTWTPQPQPVQTTLPDEIQINPYGIPEDYGQSEQLVTQPQPLTTAFLDGPHVYVAGPSGFTCLNPRTGQRLFTCPWPLPLPEAEFQATALQYEPNGIRWLGLQGQVLMRHTGAVLDGRLVMAATPIRLVTLVAPRP